MEHPLSDTIVRDQICDRFEREWMANQSLSLEQFLSKLHCSIDTATLDELLLVEMDLLHAQRIPLSESDYLRRFPDRSQVIEQGFHRLAELDKTCIATLHPTHGNLGERLYFDVPPVVGPYRIIRRIGQGAFGVVFKAECQHSGELFALKFPRRKVLRSLDELRSLIHEVEMAQLLDHPAIVRTIGIGDAEDLVFAIQEYVDGVSLAQLRPSDPRQVVAIAAKIADGLAYAHRHQLIHRDLKPANILMADSEHPKIADFGLSIHESAQRRLRGERCGTAHYMSPEQAMGLTHQLDGRSDIWSLGVLMYELLTGEYPFRGDNVDEICEEVRLRNEKPIRMIRPELDIELQRICSKCLSKSVRDRYASAHDLAEDLRSWLTLAPKRDIGSERPWVPRGMRPYRAEDADAYLRLLEGQRNRQGIPESLQFWKTSLESSHPSGCFRVGALLGPSGCGKSSFVRAGLLPLLDSNRIRSHYIEAATTGTEHQIRTALAGSISEELIGLPLIQIMDGLRNRLWQQHAQKHVLVIDQFERWLIGNPKWGETELLTALRHCDGANICAIVLVRDEYWLNASQMFQSLDVEWSEDRNIQRMDLLNDDQARLSLHRIGHAYDRLPAVFHPLTHGQRQFLKEAIQEISDNGRVTCVHLAVLAEIFKHREWTPRELRSMGGIVGVGEVYLDSTVGSRTAQARNDVSPELAERLLEQLLPRIKTSKVREHSCTVAELVQTTGASDDRLLPNTLNWLEEDLRLISRTVSIDLLPSNDSQADESGGLLEGGSQVQMQETNGSFQLAHDYLVPSLRNWLNRKKLGTWRGRAQIQFDELWGQWQLKRESRFLPSLWEHLKFRLVVPSWRRTHSQADFLANSLRKDLKRIGVAAVLLIGGNGLIRNYQSNLIESKIRTSVVRALDGVHTLDEELRALREFPSVARSVLEKSTSDRTTNKAFYALRKACILNAIGEPSDSETQAIAAEISLLDTSEYHAVLSQMKAYPALAIDVLARKFATCNTRAEQVRIAAALLYLGSSRAAETLFKNRPDPSAGTELAHAIVQLFPSIKPLWEQIQSHRGESDLLFGLLVAASRYAITELDDPDRWKELLQREYLRNPDSGVHGMCLFLAHHWGWMKPNGESDVDWRHPPATPAPLSGCEWWRVEVTPNVAMTFVEVRPGKAIRNLPELPDKLHGFFTPGPTELREGYWIAQVETPVQVLKHWLDIARPIAKDDASLIWESRNRGEITVEQRLRDPKAKSTHGLFENGNEHAALAGVTLNEFLAMTQFLNDTKSWNSTSPTSYRFGIPFLNEHDFALRAESITEFHFGDASVGNLLEQYAVTAPPIGNSSEYCALAPYVYSKLPNRFGLFNIIGNLGEYVPMSEAESLLMNEFAKRSDQSYCWVAGGKIDERISFSSWYVDRADRNTIFEENTGARLALYTKGN